MKPEQLASLNSQAKEISRKIRQAGTVHEEIRQIGQAMGRTIISAECADRLLGTLAVHRNSFALILIDAHFQELVDLPWEALILPRTGIPLLFHPEVRGNLDYARLHAEANEPGGRRAALKGLAISANSTARPLSVDRQIAELSNRFLHYPNIRPRSFIKPPIEDIKLALYRECALFIFAGHGKFENETYYIEINDRTTNIREFADSLKKSRAEMLIFDSCDSSFGGATAGLPALLKHLPAATCLLAIQGPGVDSVSYWHMPVVVEKLMIGQPVWTSVNAMRLLLYDQNADLWFLLVMHIKSTYLPLVTPEIQSRENYIDLLSQRINKRRSNQI